MQTKQNLSLTPIERKIVEIIESQEGRPIPSGIIFSKGDFKNRKAFYSALDFLVKNKEIEKLVTGKYILSYKNGVVLFDQACQGKVFINSKGDAFFKKGNDEKSSFYINKKNLLNAMDGDIVKVAPMDRESTYDDLKDAVVLEIVERNRDFFVGTYSSELSGDKKETKIIPDDLKINFKIVVDDESQLVHGSKALFQISRIKNNVIYCSLSKIIGHVNDVGTDIISIVYDNGIEPEFSEEVKKEVEKIDFNFSPEEDKRRKDLSNLNFVTIDPVTSKDMDDAIYVEKKSDGYKLYVAIADVSYYVKLKSKLWNSAVERGTSVYLVNQVIPMLPHKLSNNICSLNPLEKRYAMVCEMDVNKEGKYDAIDVYPGIIVSKKKFAYENINDYFKDGSKLENVDDNLYKMIDQAKELNEFLDKRHKKEGYIDFEIPEPNIILDENEKIKSIEVKKTGEAQKMIENFMVAANEAVTLKFNQLNKSLGFVYRVHNSPEEIRIEAFKTEAKKLGFRYDDSLKKWNPDTVSKWLITNKDFKHKELINMLLLRTMAKAKYDCDNIGHFGLSLKNYTHFTSPIRRLADVVVHHLYRAFVFDKDRYSDDDKNYLLDNLNYFNEKANETERRAVTTERDVNSMKFAEYMQGKIGQEFDGFATYIVNFGVFVQLKNTIEGCIKPMNFKDDFYVFNPEDFTFVGKKNKKVITLGQKMRIKVVGSYPETRKIDFEMVKFLD